MAILEKIKESIRKKAKLYRALGFLRGIPAKDYLNFKKLWLFKKVYPYTMVNYPKLSNIYNLAKLAEDKNIKGAFVECGVWKGGCIAVAAFLAREAKSNRKIWLFDSFEGLPEPTAKDGNRAQRLSSGKARGRLLSINKCVGPLADAERILFSILKLNKENIKIRKGWFQQTLPKARKEMGPIALLRIDADWYESTECCLDNLYDNVVPGGYIIIDDYGYWEGAKKATDQFFKKRNLAPNLTKIDYSAIYFQKP